MRDLWTMGSPEKCPTAWILLSRRISVAWLPVLIFVLAFAAPGRSHSAGENYVWLNIAEEHLEGRFEMRLPDLRQVLGLEISEDYATALEQLRANEETVRDYIRQHFALASGGRPIELEFTETNLLRSNYFGHFAQFYYRTASFNVPDELDVTNTLLFEGNDSRLHRSLLCIEFNEKTGEFYSTPGPPEEGEIPRIEFAATVFGPSNSEQTVDLTDLGGLLPLRDFVWQGVLHIWIGIDHILFLVALLLPAVLIRNRQERSWTAVPDFKSAFWNIVKVVTLFTVAHSITLCLAVLDVIEMPSRFVESTIALSIIVVALNNILPMFRETKWLVILFFGLFHGLGFASVMGHLPFRMMNLGKVVLLFNLGVELGQIAIVAAVFPLIYWTRGKKFYQPVILVGGSVLIGLIASWWFVERAFEL